MRRQRGISKLEFAVSVLLISLFAAVLLDRLLYYESVSERTYFELTLRALKNGLRWQVAHRLTNQQPVDYDSLATQNPMDWLDVPTDQYAGVISCGAVEAGTWGYDAEQHVLCYRPRFSSAFDELLDNADERLSISMKLIYNPQSDQTGGIDFKISSAD